LVKKKYADNPNVKVKNNGSNIDVTVNGQKNTYTWHHHQDGKTLMPVLTSVHSNVAATIKRGLEGIFQSPY